MFPSWRLPDRSFLRNCIKRHNPSNYRVNGSPIAVIWSLTSSFGTVWSPAHEFDFRFLRFHLIKSCLYFFLIFRSYLNMEGISSSKRERFSLLLIANCPDRLSSQGSDFEKVFYHQIILNLPQNKTEILKFPRNL